MEPMTLFGDIARTLGLIVAVGLAMSCAVIGTAEGAAPDAVCEYYPLVPGATWRLEGNPDGDGETLVRNRVVSGTEGIDGIAYFRIEQTDDDADDDSGRDIFFQRCEDSRVYQRYPDGEETLQFDFTTGINESWSVPITYSGGGTGMRTGRIVDRGATVTTPAGAFEHCIVYDIAVTRRDDGRVISSTYTMWFAPGVGIVKISGNPGVDSPVPLAAYVFSLGEYHIPGGGSSSGTPDPPEQPATPDGNAATSPGDRGVIPPPTMEMVIRNPGTEPPPADSLDGNGGNAGPMARAQAAYGKHRYVEAAALFERCIADNPQAEYVPQALYMLGNSRYNAGSLPGAVEVLDRLIDTYPRNGWRSLAMYTKAMVLLDTMRQPDAMTELRRLLEEYPDDPVTAPQAALWIGEIHYRAGRYNEALSYFEAVAARYPDEDIVQSAKARIAEIGGIPDIPQAPGGVQPTDEPDNRRDREKADFDRGRAHIGGGRLDGAAVVFERFVVEYPESDRVPEALYLLAMLYYDRGDLRLAADTCGRLIAGYPASGRRSEAIFLELMVRKALHEYPRAITLCHQLLGEYPRNERAANAAYQLGEMYYHLEDYDMALAQLQAMVADYPERDDLVALAETLIGDMLRHGRTSTAP